jgi:hypothetical protein
MGRRGPRILRLRTPKTLDQQGAAAMQARSDRTDRRVDYARNFGVRQPVKIAQGHDLTIPRWQADDGLPETDQILSLSQRRGRIVRAGGLESLEGRVIEVHEPLLASEVRAGHGDPARITAAATRWQ